MVGDHINILLVEGNPCDVRLTHEGLKEGKVLNNLFTISGCLKALVFLKKDVKYAKAV